MQYYLIAVFVFIADQLSKLAIAKFMVEGQTIPLWEGVFHFTSHRNRGAAFGILQDQRWFFIVISIVVVGGIAYYLYHSGHIRKRLSVALALIMGGALGNFADRLFAGEVVDFLDFRLINYPIFNVADSAIVIGVILYMWDTLKETKKGARLK